MTLSTYCTSIQQVIGCALNPDESSRLKAAYQAAGTATTGPTLKTLHKVLQDRSGRS
jgi:hypothetical protein